MNRLLIGLAVGITGALILLIPTDEADAHGRYGRFGVSIGYGYPGYAYPGYGWPLGYYGGYYYPRSFVGVTVRPWRRDRRDRRTRREEREVRNRALYVYPAGGQSEEQLADDRYECHVWSVDSTGFDPTLGAGSREEADDYGRAFTACMEGRGYVVR
jgi:hypothetical protein